MKKEAIVLFLAILSLAVVLAVQPTPHQFYGSVEYNGNLVAGNCEMTVRTTKAPVFSIECTTYTGKYGYNPYHCIVESQSPNNDFVQFYLNGVKIGEKKFESFGYTEMNFNLSTDPNCVIAPACGDSICNSGETCSTCSQDCGQCAGSSSSGSSSGGGSSSSSGGGGGSSSSSSGGGVILINNLSNNSSSNLSGSSSDDAFLSLGVDTPANGETQDKKNIGGGITGGVIGFARSDTGTGMIIALVIILAGIGVILFSNKNRLPENATN
ncbi:MAG: hypothetical protein AABW50_00055 [Nanoarchaeota archaeon]